MKKLIKSLAFVFFASCASNSSIQAIDFTTATGIFLSISGSAWSYISIMKAVSPFPTAYKENLRRGLITTSAGLIIIAAGVSDLMGDWLIKV